MIRFTHLLRTGVLLSLVVNASVVRGQAADHPTGFPARCATNEVQVLLLGVYHFANPGRDVIKQDIDDVLKPERQRELDDLATRLASWAPDRIAVEWSWSFTDSAKARYARYQAGTLAPTRNEVVQIGFRLAKRLGHAGVHPIDDDSFLDLNDSLRAIDQRRPEFKRSRDSISAILQARADSTNTWMRKTTIVDHLRSLNSDESLHEGNSLGMFGGYLAAGEGANYGGPEFLGKWYQRNINMAHNLTRLLQPGVKRILVVVGSGHVAPLRNILDEAPQFCPVSPLVLLR